MNKLFTKISALVLGLSMAVGVGVAIGGNTKAIEARADALTFDFEDSTAHRTSGNNNYSDNTYTENNTTITLVYADSITTGSPLSGSANIMGRIAKKTTNSPSITIGAINGLSNSHEVTEISYKIKGVSAMTATVEYKSGSGSWTAFSGKDKTATTVNNSGYSLPTSNTTKTISNLSLSGDTLSLRWTISVGSSTNSNRDFQFDDLTITYSTGGTVDTAASVVGNSKVAVGTQWSGSVTEDTSGTTVSGVTYDFSLSNGATLSASSTTNGTFTASHEGTVTVSASLSGYAIKSLAVTVTKNYDYTTSFSVVSFEEAYTATPASVDSDKMMIVGHIKSMDTNNTEHGNGYLEHNSSNRTLRIYGMYDVDGNKGDKMTNPTVPVADDVVVLEGVFCFYNSTWEIKNAVLRQKNGTVYNYPLSVSSIVVKTAPTKTTYNAGEYFAPAGLVITVTYSDDSEEDISYSGNESKFAFSPNTSTALTTSNTEVTITYGGQSTTQAITVNAVPAVISVTVSPASDSINIGATTTLTATVEVEGGAAQTVTWSSSSDSIATVENGVVTGVSAGTATITATSTVNNTKSGSATITVIDPTDTKIGTYSLVKDASLLNDGDWIVITSTNGEYGMGEQGSNTYRSQVAVTLSNSDIVISSTVNTTLKAAKISVKNNHFEIKTDEGYLYASSDSSNDLKSRSTNGDANGEWVFSIDSATGDSTCIAQGTFLKKSLRYNSGNSRFSCYSETNTMADIHIYKKMPATAAVSLTSNKSILTSIGDTATLTAKAYSDSEKTAEITGLTNADFTFESGDTNILTVNASGVVTAVATGETTITVSRNECEASVTIKVVFVTIDLINNGTSVEAGSNGTFTFSWSSDTLKPSTYSATWSSNDNDAFVVSTDGSYTAGAAGKSATITVSVTDGNSVVYTATKTFSTVSAVVLPTHISVTESSGVVAYVGTNVNLHISVLGAGDVAATNQNVTCTSSNQNVLTVTNLGVITPKTRGVATVTVVDEAEICTPVVISVRVRNVVLGDASVIGTFDFTDYTVTGKTMADWYTKGTADYSSAEFTGGYQSADDGYIRFGSGSAVGAITVSYSSAIVKKVVVSAKLYGSDAQDCGIEGTTAVGSFNATDFDTITYTFDSAVDEFTFTTNASKKRLYVESITIYTAQADLSLEASAQALYEFEELNMHLDDYNSNLGYCKDSEHHYYETAKAAFNALSSKELRDMYTTNPAFAEGWARLSAWAAANGESLNSSSQLASSPNVISMVFSGNNAQNNVLLVVISIISLSSLGGYFFIRRRRER